MSDTAYGTGERVLISGTKVIRRPFEGKIGIIQRYSPERDMYLVRVTRDSLAQTDRFFPPSELSTPRQGAGWPT